MIASVRGTVAHIGLDVAVIEVGGVGLAVRATPTTLAGLRAGAEGRLSTSLVVREDSLTLMGFADDDERDTYETLQSVSGIGPKTALAMLAVHTPDALRRALAAEDLAALMRVPGIGRKGAQRLVLEIGDKLGPARAPLAGGAAGDDTGDDAAGGTEAVDAALDAGAEQVVEALIGLGWQRSPAVDAVGRVTGAIAPPARRGAAAEPAAPADLVDPADTPAVLRAALQLLAGGRRG